MTSQVALLKDGFVAHKRSCLNSLAALHQLCVFSLPLGYESRQTTPIYFGCSRGFASRMPHIILFLFFLLLVLQRSHLAQSEQVSRRLTELGCKDGLH